MYFEQSKKSYYRFPTKSSLNELDSQIPYYFPTNNNYPYQDSPNTYHYSNEFDITPDDQILGSEHYF